MAGLRAARQAVLAVAVAWVLAFGRVLSAAVATAAAIAPALALALALAPAAHAQLPEPLAGKPVRAVRFVGSLLSSEAFLREQVRVKVGDSFDPAVLDEDVRRLFLTGRVSGDIEARPELIDGGVVVTFVVHEHDIVRDIVYEDLDTFDEEDLDEGAARRLRLRRGRPYEEYRARLDERFIKERLATKGKLFAEIDRTVERVGADATSGVKVIFHVREGPTVRVDDITFIGNDHYEPDELRKYMRTQTTVLYVIRSGYFDQGELDLDLQRLRTFYRSEGYLDARVFLERLDFSADRSDVEVVIRVVEGARYNVRAVEVKVLSPHVLLTPEAIERELETKEGQPFSGRALEQDLRSIERRYANRGYIFARARYEQKVVAGAAEIDLLFTVEEGDAVSVERIRIEGNWRTRDDVIRRELSLLPGEPFDASKLDDSRDRLGRRGLFKDVQVRFEDGTSTDKRDVVLRVEEGDTGQILLGGGVSSSSGFFGRFVYQQRNFDIMDWPTSLEEVVDIFSGKKLAGAGQILTFQAEPGSQRSSYRLSFVEPYFLPDLIPVPLQLRTSFVYSDSVLARTFVEQRLQWSVGLGYRIGRDSLIELGYRITSVDVFDVDSDAPADVVEVVGENLISAVSLGFQINKNLIDQYFLAYGGWGFQITGELAGGPWRGDHDFWQVTAEANWQTTLFQWPRTSRHVIQLRAGAGIGRAYGRNDSIPIFERFFAGGPRSVRGFEVRSVGPQADDEPLGGNVRVVGTVEYSFPIIPGFDDTYAPQWRGDFLRGVLFLDVGNVEEEFGDLSTDDFRSSVGFGFRIKIPIFQQPLAIDFGWPLHELDLDDPEIFSLSVDVPF